ncbi:MAG: DUF433 domain-containing protein [Anaerolineales bacterium]|nr:DUF433 domain-containing protein [Anaerolineales bacterium]
MLSYPETHIIPLTTTPEGVVQVAGTRIGLDIVVEEYNAGMSAEEIAYNYPSLSLSDVYAVITYYLLHKNEADRYIAQLHQQAEQTRLATEAQYGLSALRQRLIKQSRSQP